MKAIAKRRIVFLALAGLLALGVCFRSYLWVAVSPAMQKLRRPKTTEQRLEECGPRARARLLPYFKRRDVSYPPQQVILVGLKQEKVLELYASNRGKHPTFVRAFPILGLSGKSGPKLREGDHQVPEGIYPIESLNPNSRFHVALRVGYPNVFDLEQASREGRSNPGSDIMIHGSFVSAGCLAMGDEAAEDLFVLAADAGITNVTVILSPVDFRLGKATPSPANLPSWSGNLYTAIRRRLSELPKPRDP